MLSHQPFLIIAGTYRAGTTALFSHLSRHPEVMPARYKELAFFFSDRWNEDPPLFPPGQEAETYLASFHSKPGGRVLMEATPNYLHDPGCAERIRHALPEAKMVVLLRDPIDRLRSWFRHSQYQGRLPAGLRFDDWVDGLFADERPLQERPYMQRALEHGRYAAYVGELIDVFGPDRVLVAWFDDLGRAPRRLVEQVCTFAGISPTLLPAEELAPVNEAMRMPRPRLYNRYLRLCRRALDVFGRWPRLRHRAQAIVYAPEPAIRRRLSLPADPVDVRAETMAALERYYEQDIAPLEAVVGAEVPWAARWRG